MTAATTPATDMPERIYAVKSTNGCVVSFSTPSLDYNIEYMRADLVCSERERAVRECLRALNEDSSRSWDECYDAILALLHTSCERSVWKTIQTAPKDGTVIFAFSDEAQTPKAVLTWFDGEKWLATGKRAKFVANPHRWWPTHWQPIPTPPALSQEERT